MIEHVYVGILVKNANPLHAMIDAEMPGGNPAFQARRDEGSRVQLMSNQKCGSISLFWRMILSENRRLFGIMSFRGDPAGMIRQNAQIFDHVGPFAEVPSARIGRFCDAGGDFRIGEELIEIVNGPIGVRGFPRI